MPRLWVEVSVPDRERDDRDQNRRGGERASEDPAQDQLQAPDGREQERLGRTSLEVARHEQRRAEQPEADHEQDQNRLHLVVEEFDLGLAQVGLGDADAVGVVQGL